MKSFGKNEGQGAQGLCESHGADVPLPVSEAQNNGLITALDDMEVNVAWIGISDSGQGFCIALLLL